MAILTLVIAAVFAALFFAAKKAPHPCRLLAPSALAVCACAVCLSATTYAWFSATSTSQVATIQAATYDVTVNGYATTATETGKTYSVQLDAGLHEITLVTIGTTNTGYCEIVFNDTTYYTSEFVNGSFTFGVGTDQVALLTITPKWGVYPAGITANIENGGAIGITTTSLFTIEPPETPEIPPVDPTPETPENPDNTYLVEDDTAVTTQE